MNGFVVTTRTQEYYTIKCNILSVSSIMIKAESNGVAIIFPFSHIQNLLPF